VLNRFLAQAANQVPLTVYGTGGQSRAFIHVSDTARCLQLALENADFDASKVRIFNQVSEVRSVLELARIVGEKFKVDYQLVDNPRKEAPENDLEVSNAGLKSLGFEPITLADGLLSDVKVIAENTKPNFSLGNVLTSPVW
jgi:UDP-sulfoquinovose synthase